MRTPLLSALLILTSMAARAGAAEGRADEVDSKALGKKMPLLVLLPDGYDADPAKRYPVVYLLHGIGGDYREWQRVGIEKEAAGLPVIVVMPEGDQSFYVNIHDDPKGRWEDYITGEVVAHVDAKYRTIAAREARGISGLSMGGYGAVVLGLRKPGLFSTIASHSGALGAVSMDREGPIGERIKQVFGPPGSSTRKDYDPVLLLKAVPAAERPKIYIDCGAQDFLLESNRAFVRELASAAADYEYRELPGRHDFAYWKANVRTSLSRQLEAMAQAAEKARSAPHAAKEAPAAAPAAARVDGSWKLLVDIGGQSNDYTLRIRAAGDKLEGVLVSPRSGEHKFQTVAWKDGKLHMEILRNYEGQEIKWKYDGELTEKGLAGKVVPEGFENEFSGTWTAEREAAGAAAEKL
jgi:S-formylglutathione hydrolase FrmB